MLLTGMAFPLDATFSEYAFAICGSLGLTAGLIAAEDSKKKSVRDA
jgi:hypothetical protein